VPGVVEKLKIYYVRCLLPPAVCIGAESTDEPFKLAGTATVCTACKSRSLAVCTVFTSCGVPAGSATLSCSHPSAHRVSKGEVPVLHAACAYSYSKMSCAACFVRLQAPSLWRCSSPTLTWCGPQTTRAPALGRARSAPCCRRFTAGSQVGAGLVLSNGSLPFAAVLGDRLLGRPFITLAHVLSASHMSTIADSASCRLRTLSFWQRCMHCCYDPLLQMQARHSPMQGGLASPTLNPTGGACCTADSLCKQCSTSCNHGWSMTRKDACRKHRLERIYAGHVYDMLSLAAELGG
jgi:hypothetical protein